MTKETLDRYAEVARTVDDDFLVAGRYESQKHAWPYVIADVLAKLRFTGSETLLDIGSGPGLLTLPLAGQARQVWALDHAEVVQRLALRAGDLKNLTCLEGDFRSFDFGGQRFDRVLSYSMAHCLPDLVSVDAFVDKALSLLAPGGIALVGDLPNHDRKQRFLASPFGKRLDEDFARRRATEPPASGRGLSLLAGDAVVGSFDESYLLSLVARLRREGFDAALLPQRGELCFGWTREDLVVSRLPE